MTNPVQEAQRLGQSIWYDNIRRGLLTSGEMRRLIPNPPKEGVGLAS